MRFNETKEITAVLLTASKRCNVSLLSDVYNSVWFELGRMIVTIKLYTLILPWPCSRSQQYEKAKTSAPIHKVFNWFGWNLAYCWDLVWWTFHLFYFSPISCSRERTLLVSFVRKSNTNFNVGLDSYIYRLIYFKLGRMIETTKLYILISVWMNLTFIQGHSCMTKQKNLVHVLSQQFCGQFGWNQLCSTTCWFVAAHAEFLCTSNFQGRELCWRDFVK